MSGRTTPSGIRPPSGAYGHGSMTPGTPSNKVSRQEAHETVGSPSPAVHTSSTTNGAASTSVQVALRIRPPPPPDANSAIPPRFQRSVVHPLAGSATQLSVEAAPVNGKGPAKQSFSFDRVLGTDDGQPQVYDTVEPLVSRFLEGYNVTVLAYGQTSSGKSYTMGTDLTTLSPEELSDDNRTGIIPRAVRQLFSDIQRKTRSEGSRWKVEAKNSYVEIYNEDLIDLLSGDMSPEDRPAVTIREDKAGHIFWSGLREVKVSSVEDVMRNLSSGSAVRQTGSTAMNDQSSRSHAIFSITLTQRKYTGQGSPKLDLSPPTGHQSVFGTPSRIAQRQSISNLYRVGSPTPGSVARPGTPGDSRPGSRLLPRPGSVTGRASSPSFRDDDDNNKTPHGAATPANGTEEWTTVTSKFHFVDLAGSERLKRTSAMGDRAKEGISINAGLSALGNVISALGDPVKARQTTHIPYRDSKLTRLLQDSLGGNAHTLMIACVSPAEYNLSETLNTLKYANRARNIKNRAELNEVEVGWEDVEHLQQLVTRLRGELSAIRNGGPMPSISEEDAATRSGMSASAEVLEMQEQYSDLSTRYAKLTAELAKAQSSPVQMSAESFAMAVEPVVEEYEKSISALESQLSLTKAALTHSEEIMREKDEKLHFENQVSESNARVIGDLKMRLAKLAEREGVTENYVRDLEARLKSSADQDEASAGLVGELRKEVAKYREVEMNTEQYIKDLEARLSKSEEMQQMQKAQIDTLERDVQRREKAYEELEGRLSLLDTTEQHKQLLRELDERDKRMMVLQHELDEARASMAAMDRNAESLKATTEKDSEEKQSLHRRINSLEKKSALNARVILREPSPSSSPVVTSLTPPQTPFNENECLDVGEVTQERQELLTRFSSLQKKHDAAIAEIDNLSGRYQSSLKEIEQLRDGSSRRRKRSTASSGSPEISDSPTSTRDEIEELQDSVRPSLLPTNSSYNTPTRASRSVRSSMPLSPRGSFLGRSPVTSSSASHLRSVSLSQELSLARSSNGPNMHSGLPQPPHTASGMLQTGTLSPRSTSPLFSRRDSLLFSGNLPQPEPQERSNESLSQEVKKLQETLNEREEEIRALEISLTQIRTSQPPTPNELALPKPGIVADESMRTPDITVRLDPLSLSPNALEAFNAIKASIDHPGDPTHADDTVEQQMARLDDLMLSMAKKEVAHRETVDELDDQLSSLKRQHDDLKALSKDQVHNMSTEITALREQLALSTSDSSVWTEKLNSMQSSLDGKEKEIEALLASTAQRHQNALDSMAEGHAAILQQKEAEHAQRLLETQEEHASLLRRMLEAKEELFMRKAEEHDAALQWEALQHQEATKAMSREHDSALVSLRSEMATQFKRKDVEHAEALERFELQAHAMQGDNNAAVVESLTAQHEKAIQARSADFQASQRDLEERHASTLASVQQEHSDTLERVHEEHKAGLTRLLDDHAATLQQVREERDDLLKRSDEEHAEELASRMSQHYSEKEDLLAAHSSKLLSVQAEHDDSLRQLQEQHETALASSREANEQTLLMERQKASEAREALLSEHQAAIQTLSDSHDAALQQLMEEHASSVASLRSEVENNTASAECQREEALAKQSQSHAEAIAALQEHRAETDSSAQLDALRADHEQTLEQLQLSHTSSLSGLTESHQSTLADLKKTYEETLAEQTVSHQALLEEARSSHSEELRQLQAQLAEHALASQANAEELSAAQSALSRLQVESAGHERNVGDLQYKLAQHGGAQQEVERLQRSLEITQKSETALGTELQEALDALGTLEKALIESQDERERLMSEIHDLKKRKREKSLQAELTSSSKENEVLKAELRRMNSLMGKKRPQSPPSVTSMQGLGINGFASEPRDFTSETLMRTSSSTSELELYMDAPFPPTPNLAANGMATPSLPFPPARHSSVTALAHASSHVSKPPPTPPPSMPPPPLPTEALMQQQQLNQSTSQMPGMNGANALFNSSISSSSNNGRASVSSNYTRDSHMDTPSTSQRTNSLSGDTISVEPRVLQKLEEQEANLVKLTKRLDHCETELKANIDLVTTLESALNDSERNLRKARLQMNELAKERDNYQGQSNALRQQMQDAQNEVDNARHSLAVHEEEARQKLEAQRRVQREAQQNAEQRMQEMQRMNRKSKFNCF